MSKKKNTAIEMVNTLKAAGWKVSVRHYRTLSYAPTTYFGMDEIKKFGLQDVLSHFGGKTIATVSSDDDTFVVESKCSNKDRFIRRVGTNIVLARAIKEAGI